MVEIDAKIQLVFSTFHLWFQNAVCALFTRWSFH